MHARALILVDAVARTLRRLACRHDESEYDAYGRVCRRCGKRTWFPLP